MEIIKYMVSLSSVQYVHVSSEYLQKVVLWCAHYDYLNSIV